MLEINKIDKFDNIKIFKNIEKYLKNCTETNVTFLFEYYDGLKRKKYAVADYFKNNCGDWNGIIGGYFEHDFVNIATVTGFVPMKEILVDNEDKFIR